MTRADFTGPVRSNAGFEVGSGDDVITVIDSSGTIYTTMNIGTTASPVTVIGDVTGDVTGNVTGNLTGDVTGDVGSTASPSNVYGYLSGAFSGNVALAASTVAAASLSTVSAGYFQVLYTSTGGLVLKTSTGLVGTITVTT